ncbi:MAG: PEP-CTERM sorting domain-containing protein [Candidatus Thiodiazotropha sp.]
MNIKQTLLKTSAILALCAFSSTSSATILSIGDMASFSFSSQDLFDYSAAEGARTERRDVQTVTLDRFDGSLGRLLDVEIWLESEWSLGSAVRSYDTRFRASATGAGRSISRQAVRLVDPNREVEINREVIRNNCRDLLSCSEGSLESGDFSEAFDLSSFGLEEFVGSNSLDLRIVRNLVADLTRCGRYDSCAQRNKYNAWSGNVYVSYLYDDSPEQEYEEVEVNVPEPSTLVLLGMGLLGVGASRLYRKKNV